MKNEENILERGFENSTMGRLDFLKYTGVAAATAVILPACKKESTGGVDLGSGDYGVLNYAYALEQLEAAFYTSVINGSYYANASAAEKAILGDIQKHEVGHRDFFKAALGTHAIIDLSVNFSTINFADRNSVLMAAMAFEDLGVSAYNGAGHLIDLVDYLLVAGKIVSVEARHAATIRDLLNSRSNTTGSFAGDDQVDGNGLDKSRTPSEVLAIAKTYLVTELNASNLPNR